MFKNSHFFSAEHLKSVFLAIYCPKSVEDKFVMNSSIFRGPSPLRGSSSKLKWILYTFNIEGFQMFPEEKGRTLKNLAKS